MNKKYKDIGDPLDKLSEEASEVIHAVCKAKRFGLKNYHPSTPCGCNASGILDELLDLERIIKEVKPILNKAAREFSIELNVGKGNKRK